MLPLKALLVSAAVIFTALGMKASLPLATTHLPLLWSFFLLCFTPPYLYVTVNAIIISILASSRFHFHHSPAQPNHPIDSTPPPVLEVKAVLVNGSVVVQEEEEEVTKEIDLGMVLKRMDSPEEIPPEYLSPMEKPLVSARFSHRKPLKSNPEGGRVLRVAKPKRHETLENTWKAITEGRSMPLSRHMKKCDTWQNSGDTGPLELEPTTVNKCETFNVRDGTNQPPKLRKEPSLSQDELNRRVEAFIHKFNQQMRLQRQESLNHYMHMINRGTS